MIDRITEQPFCQTRVSGSTFVNADCFDVFPFIEDKYRCNYLRFALWNNSKQMG
jgi:hypothetical protein